MGLCMALDASAPSSASSALFAVSVAMLAASSLFHFQSPYPVIRRGHTPESVSISLCLLLRFTPAGFARATPRTSAAASHTLAAATPLSSANATGAKNRKNSDRPSADRTCLHTGSVATEPACHTGSEDRDTFGCDRTCGTPTEPGPNLPDRTCGGRNLDLTNSIRTPINTEKSQHIFNLYELVIAWIRG